MGSFAGFEELTYVNGTTPAINEVNLNKNESALANLMDEANYSNDMTFQPLLQHAHDRQCKAIELFDGITTWTYSGTYDATEEIGVPMGETGLKIAETDNSAGTIVAYKDITSIDLTTYNDGTPVDSSGLIMFYFYISDLTLLNYIQLELGTDATNYYRYRISTSIGTGWNLIQLQKSDFTTTGSPAGWDDVTRITIRYATNINASGSYIILNYLGIQAKDTSYYESNPYYWSDGAGNFTETPYIYSITNSIIYYDKRYNKYVNYNPWIDGTYGLDVYNNINSFSVKAEAYSRYTGSGLALLWYIDDDNFILITVMSSTLYISQMLGGSFSDLASTPLNDTLEFLDRMVLEVDRTPDNVIHAKLTVDGQASIYADAVPDFDIDEDGTISFVTYEANQRYSLTDFIVSTKQIAMPTFMTENILVKRKYVTETVTSSTTMQDDDELYFKFPPNCTYEIITKFVVTGSSSGDFKCKWVATGGVYQLTTRGCLGAGVGITSGTADTDCPMRDTSHNLTTEVAYGCDASFGIFVQERFLIKTGTEGGKLQLQWAQNSSYSTGTTVSTNSYLLAKKIGY